jgi:hypothetical protein
LPAAARLFLIWATRAPEISALFGARNEPFPMLKNVGLASVRGSRGTSSPWPQNEGSKTNPRGRSRDWPEKEPSPHTRSLPAARAFSLTSNCARHLPTIADLFWPKFPAGQSRASPSSASRRRSWGSRIHRSASNRSPAEAGPCGIDLPSWILRFYGRPVNTKQGEGKGVAALLQG